MHQSNPPAQNTRDIEPQTLTNEQTAKRLGVSTHYLNNMRYVGRGPSFIRLSKRRVVYKASDVDAWMQAHTVAVPEV